MHYNDGVIVPSIVNPKSLIVYQNMASLSRNNFLKTMPDVVVAHLPLVLQGIKSRQPWGWLVQFHYGEPGLHYEVSKVSRTGSWELGAWKCASLQRPFCFRRGQSLHSHAATIIQ